MPRGKRNVEVGVTSKSRDLDKDLRKNRKRFQAFGKKARRDLARSFSGVRSDMVGALGAGLSIGLLAQQARGVIDFDNAMTRLRINQGKSKIEMSALRKEIGRVSVAWGVSRESVFEMIRSYVAATGNLDVAVDKTELFAKALVATGASGEDLAKTLASLQGVFNLKPDEFEKALSMLQRAGSMGSVEFAEMGSLLGPILAQFSKFGRTGVHQIGEVIGAIQVMQAEFGMTPEKAATAFDSLITQLIKNKDVLKRAGVVVFEHRGGKDYFKSFGDVIDQFKGRGLLDNQGELFKLLKESKAITALRALGKDENRAKWRKISAETQKANDVQKNAQEWVEDSAGRTAAAMARMKQTMAEVFTPERIEKFAEAMERVADAVAWIADNLGVAGAALAAWKLGPGLLGLLAAQGGAGGALGAVGKGAGAVAKGFLPVTLSGAAGYGIGTYADRKFGISDWLTGTSRGAGIDAVSGRGRYADILDAGTKLDGPNNKRFANMILRRSRELGLTDEGGNFQRDYAVRTFGGDAYKLLNAISAAKKVNQVELTVKLDKRLLIIEDERSVRKGED